MSEQVEVLLVGTKKNLAELEAQQRNRLKDGWTYEATSRDGRTHEVIRHREVEDADG